MKPLRPEWSPTQSSFHPEDQQTKVLIEQLVELWKDNPNRDLLYEILVTAAKLHEQGVDRGDLKILRTSIKELRYAFKVFSRYRGSRKVAIFGSARSKPTEPEYETARAFAQEIVSRGFMVITGAGGGIMEAGNVGAGAENSFGLNISLPFEQAANVEITGNEKLVNFRYFFSRKLFFIKESDAIVLFPGGFGTLDEGFEALTLIQTGKDSPGPVVMLDRPGGTYWTEWKAFVESHLIRRGLVSPEDESLFYIADSIDDACREIQRFYRRYHSSRYVLQRKQLVLRLTEPLDESRLEQLNGQFRDILTNGEIESCGPAEEEVDEPELAHLPRLSLSFDQRHFGRLRQLIDAINAD